MLSMHIFVFSPMGFQSVIAIDGFIDWFFPAYQAWDPKYENYEFFKSRILSSCYTHYYLDQVLNSSRRLRYLI